MASDFISSELTLAQPKTTQFAVLFSNLFEITFFIIIIIVAS